MGFKPGDLVRKTGTDRTDVVTSFPGEALEVEMDDDTSGPGPNRWIAADLLNKHARLFQAAQKGMLAGCQFRFGGELYSVQDTLRAVARELKKRGPNLVFAREAAARDLFNILAQQSEWEQ